MRAKELIPILAEIYSFPFETAFMIDRSLAENGLRAKGRGKTIPQMTRREAIIFLVACMVNQRTTRGADDVIPWLSAEGQLQDYFSGVPDEVAAASLGIDAGKFNRPKIQDSPLAYNYSVDEVLRTLGYGNDRKPHDINLIDFLEATCDFIESHPSEAEGFRLEISLSHGWATLTWPGVSLLKSRIEFSAQDKVLAFDKRVQISRSTSIEGGALLALTSRTPSRQGANANLS